MVHNFSLVAHLDHQPVHALPLTALAGLVALRDVDVVLQGAVANCFNLLQCCLEQAVGHLVPDLNNEQNFASFSVCIQIISRNDDELGLVTAR